MRPCIIEGEYAIFYGWFETEDVYYTPRKDVTLRTDQIERMVENIKRTGVIPQTLLMKKVKTVKGLVNFMNGSVGYVEPEKITFIDVCEKWKEVMS